MKRLKAWFCSRGWHRWGRWMNWSGQQYRACLRKDCKEVQWKLRPDDAKP